MLLAPTSNLITFQSGYGGSSLTLMDLMEPSVIPEPEESMRVTEHHTRPGKTNGGWRTVQLYPATDNLARVKMKLGYLLIGDILTIQAWRRQSPPTIRWTNNGVTWYLGYMPVFTPFNYKFNQRQFMGADVQMEFLGTV